MTSPRQLAWLAAFDGNLNTPGHMHPIILADGWPAFLKFARVEQIEADAIVVHGAFGWGPGRVAGTQWDGTPVKVEPLGPLDWPTDSPVIATFPEGMSILHALFREVMVYLGGPVGTVDPRKWAHLLLKARVSTIFDVFGDAIPCAATRKAVNYMRQRAPTYLENHTAHTDHWPDLPRLSADNRAVLVEAGDYLKAPENLVWARNTDPNGWLKRWWSTAWIRSK